MKFKRITITFWTTADREKSIKALIKTVGKLQAGEYQIDDLSIFEKKWWEFWK